MTRKTLPNRRPNVKVNIEYGNSEWVADIGFDPKTGKAKEIFINGMKGELAGIVSDACVAISRLMQHGESAADMVSHFGGTEFEPASILGTVARVVAQVEEELQIAMRSLS